MQKLPIGIQFFDSLREGNFLYVDKTEQIHRLINTGTFVFLSRPRRFGKSLLVSTLQHLFQGHKQLFQGLWIEDKIYILEFKMSSAQIALDQIKARGYDQPYRASGKPIVLIGIAFDKERRMIGDWKREPETFGNDQ